MEMQFLDYFIGQMALF